MKTTSKLFGLFSLVLGLAACNAPSAPAPSANPSEEAIQASMATLQHIAVSGQHLAVGFDSADEARVAERAEPLPVFMVRLDDMRSYREGQDPEALLVDVGRTFYPVLVGSTVRTSIELTHANGVWEMSTMGDKVQAQMVQKARAQVASATGVGEDQFILVRIPALYQTFVGHGEAQGLMLTPIADDASLDLHAGQPIAASELFTRLAPVAAQADPMER